MNQREQNYDYLRSISCVAIVLLHVSSSYWYVVNPNSMDFTIMTIYNSLTRFAVPVFMMLSGAFLLEPQRAVDIKNCVNRFGKYVFNFYLWSAFFAFQGLAMKFVTGKEITGELWNHSWERFFWGHYHMWYLFLIFGFYLLLPIVRKLAESKTVIEYYLILWVLTRYLFPILGSIEALSWINVWITKLDMNMLVGYLGYFILGFYIRKYGFSKKIRPVIYLGGVVGFVYSIIGTIAQSRIQGTYVESYFSPGSWNVLLFSMAIFTFFSYLKRVDYHAFVCKTASYSFIVYMIHPFFLEKLNLIGVTAISFNCLLSIPVLTIGIFLCSFLAAAIIKNIPYINKLLI